MTSRYGLSIYSIHRATLFLSVRQGRCPRAMLSTSEVKRQPHELIDCAAADRLRPSSPLDCSVAIIGLHDSLLEGDGFEPSVPRQIRPASRAVRLPCRFDGLATR